MIVLKKLSWSNCFSYGADNEIDLDKCTLTQIIGINGTGKSSIPLILEECLYNKNSAGKKKSSIPNRYIAEGYSITLTFSKDNDQYEINVDRKTSIKLKLSKNGEDISSHTATNTYKTIQEILGVDHKTFAQLVYQNTSASLQFLTATDTNRKKFLIDLLHLEEYVILFEKFKLAAKKLNALTIQHTSTIATIEKWLLDNKLTDTTILSMLNLDIDTSKEEKDSRKLSVELLNVRDKNSKISSNNLYKDLLSKIDLDAVNSIKATEIISYDTKQAEIGELRASINTSKALVAKLNKLDGICHVCEQKVDKDFISNLTTMEVANEAVANAALNGLSAEISEIKTNNTEFTLKVKKQKEWEELYRSIDTKLPENLLDAAELSSKLKKLEETLSNAKISLRLNSRENERRTKQNTRIQIITEQTEDFLAQLAKAQESLEGQTEILSNLEMLKTAFSTNGLIAYKIENQVKDLEVLVNAYLAELSYGRFTLEFVISNNKLNVSITDDGYVIDIADLSTGQLARVNTATLLAIRKLLASISRTRINVLFLDEVVSVLDDEGKEKLVEVLLREEELNTFAVAHAWTHPLLEKITVLQKDKISYLEK